MELAARGRILVVDDDAVLARSIARLVAPLGEPALAGTAREGIDLLGDGTFCRAAILGLMLPDGTAIDILTHARRAGISMPTLVLTGQADSGAESAVRDMGADYRLKPIGNAAIERFVRECKATPAEATGAAPASAASRLVIGMAHAAVADLRAQYDIGQFVHHLRYPEPGETLVRQDLLDLGKRLDLHPSGLRRHARVSELIRPEEFEVLVALRSPRGLPLTWSHLELLSMVRSRPRREAIARQALAEDLGVRQCSALVSSAARERRRRGS